MMPIEAYATLAALLFSLGVLGLLLQKNALRILISVELVLNAANINFVAFAHHYGQADGLAFALFVIALAAAEAAVGLSIFIHLYRHIGTVDVTQTKELKF